MADVTRENQENGPIWSNDDVLQFLDYYEEEEGLWKASSGKHKNRNDAHDSWKRIELKLGSKYSIKELKRKKESLLARFRDLKNKVMSSRKSGAGSIDVYKPTWFAFDKMASFLMDKDHPRGTIDTENPPSFGVPTDDVMIDTEEFVSDMDRSFRDIENDCIFLCYATGLGVTAGAHRLWTHRSYKAKLPLRIFLAFFNCMALQNDIYEWARDHRVHHKFAETNADPHNVNRGFFFAHMGWLMARKQKDVIEKGKTVDVSDIWADPVVRFQHRFYVPLSAICCFIIPPAIPYYCWNEEWYVCVFGGGFFRYVICLHFTWFVNSAAHLWGNKPYDKNISATESTWVSALAIGEGFHNYHHTFPWDYATSELGYKYNFSTFFIDCMAYIGQAYDLKTANPDVVYQRKVRTGDGSYFTEEEKQELHKHHKD